MENALTTIWSIVATILVLSMQAGFLMLEGGRVRAKNSINVAQKNVTDLVIIWVVFFGGGCFVMFGLSPGAILGEASANANPSSSFTPLHFIFQLAFCATTATIVSGAVAERISFKAYLMLVALIGALIYPIMGRMVWGNTYNPEVNAYLAGIGFIDFAGSTVVHGVGAWIALTALMMIGPRVGRFDQDGKPQVMPAYNSVIALFGVFILMFGWLGFNGGSLSINDPRLPGVLFYTLTSGVFGGAAGMSIGYFIDKGVFNPSRVTSGLLGGLVACAASVLYMNTLSAILVGIGGGAIATYSAHVLLFRFKLDDPLDAIAVHGAAGVFGTLAVAFVVPISQISSQSRVTQLGIQSLGVVGVFVFTVAITWIALSLLRRFMELRVSSEAERLGLNYTEHGEIIGLNRLQNALEQKLNHDDSFAGGVSIDSDDEHSELAATLNDVISRFESANIEVKHAQRRFKHFAETASDWLWESDAELT